MDRLWSPWRFPYVRKAAAREGCIFCEKAAAVNDEENLVLWRSTHSYLLLNLFPYNTGHLMVAPYEHVATLDQTPLEILQDVIALVQRGERALRAAYQAPGYNMGLNVGEVAGAGIAQHLHFHVVPRWPGDANFMTTIGQTRVLPEDLGVTYEKLQRVLVPQ